MKWTAFGRQRGQLMHGVVRKGVLYALALPANIARAAQTAIPVSRDFVMVVPSFAVQRHEGAASAAARACYTSNKLRAAGSIKMAFRRLNSLLRNCATLDSSRHRRARPLLGSRMHAKPLDDQPGDDSKIASAGKPIEIEAISTGPLGSLVPTNSSSDPPSVCISARGGSE
jgi:hypothetical protein